jgi:hypothetical protein
MFTLWYFGLISTFVVAPIRIAISTPAINEYAHKGIPHNNTPEYPEIL